MSTNQTDTEASEQQLASIRAWAHSNHGTIRKIADRLSLITGRAVMRQTVGRWLHKNKTKRQQPSYGFGLLLERSAREIQSEQATEAIPE